MTGRHADGAPFGNSAYLCAGGQGRRILYGAGLRPARLLLSGTGLL